MLKDVFQFIMIVGIGGAFCGGFLLSAAVSWVVRFFYKYADDEMQIKLDATFGSNPSEILEKRGIF